MLLEKHFFYFNLHIILDKKACFVLTHFTTRWACYKSLIMFYAQIKVMLSKLISALEKNNNFFRTRHKETACIQRNSSSHVSEYNPVKAA